MNKKTRFGLAAVIAMLAGSIGCYKHQHGQEAIAQGPTPTPPPTPIIYTAPPVPPPPPLIIRTPPPPTFTPPVVVPTDATFPDLGTNANVTGFETGNLPGVAASGLSSVAEKSFPHSETLTGNTDWIIVHAGKDTVYERISPYLVQLKSGKMLVGVKRPSNTAMLKTAFGDVAIVSNADAMVSYNGDTLRIMNLDGRGQTVLVKLDQGPFAGGGQKIVAIKPGFELVASSHPLSRDDMRPSDGVARRHFHIYDNKMMAVSEFSLESFMKSSELITDLGQQVSGSQEKRVMGDMSKMASVLNQVNGTQGYVATK